MNENGRWCNLVLISSQNATAFKEVRLRALKDSPSAFGSTYDGEVQLSDTDWRERAEQWSGERSAAYLAMEGATPRGIIGVFLHKDDATRAVLVSMWVAPERRRQNVGHILIGTVCKWARAQNACALHLMVTSNNEAAIAFYQRLGFAMTGYTEPYPNDPALIEHEMVLSLVSN